MVGVSKDVDGKPAIRLALQTREQHIRRDKATSNICTAQVLLAIMASMYAVYHGPRGLKEIAEQIHFMTAVLAKGLKKLGYDLGAHPYFDTLRVQLGDRSSSEILDRAKAKGVNLRQLDEKTLCVALDETVRAKDVQDLLAIFGAKESSGTGFKELSQGVRSSVDPQFARGGSILAHPVFNKYHSETELLRYITKLQSRDLSLAHSMIPLGSCTMKLNATSEMLPVTWPEFGKLHPFVPAEQAQGYAWMIQDLEKMLG